MGRRARVVQSAHLTIPRVDGAALESNPTPNPNPNPTPTTNPTPNPNPNPGEHRAEFANELQVGDLPITLSLTLTLQKVARR